MFCIFCGAENPDQASFCGRCGQPLEKAGNAPAPNRPDSPNMPGASGQSLFTSPWQGQPPIANLPMRPRNPQGMQGLPLQATPSWEAPPPNPNYEQFSYSEPPPVQTQPPSPGSSEPFQASSPSWQGSYPYSAPTQQGFPSSSTFPDRQMPVSNSYSPPAFLPEATPPASTTHQSELHTLAKPLPIWAFILSIVAVILILAAFVLTGSDWAAGAAHAGIVAGIIALLIIVATVVRAIAGMASRANPKRRIQFISAGLFTLILLAICGTGLTQQPTVHALQGHFLEGQQQWQPAITQYQLAGENAPTSDNIARTYAKWGEQFSSQQHYEMAIAKFDTVLNNYSSVSSEVARAQADNISAYLDWGKQAAQQRDYAAATNHYDTLLNLPYCNSNCHAQVSALDATAYYNQAESQLTLAQFADAITSFMTVVTRFPSSSEAGKLHRDYAKALFGQGKQQLATSCPSAIPTYQELSTKFADTPEGQQATDALQAPQPVKGRFTSSVPRSSSLTPVAVLAQGLYMNIPNDQFFRTIAGAPTVVINSDGTFTFKPVKQGTYDLAWGTNNTDGYQSFYFSYRSDKSLVYVATVGLLCPFDFGDINETIPSAP